MAKITIPPIHPHYPIPSPPIERTNRPMLATEIHNNLSLVIISAYMLHPLKGNMWFIGGIIYFTRTIV